MDRSPRVVIVGGGFAGLNAARALASAHAEVILVDRRNHHLFQPLLYQVATAALSPADIASPIRGILRKQENTEVVMSEVSEIRPGEREIVLGDGERLGYDYLVLATGSVDQFFGNPGWGEASTGLKSIDDAVEIRRRFLVSFEAAEREADPERRRALLTTVVIGAGPTGVEMAGALSEIARHSLTRDFRNIDPSSARVVLLEAGERVLPAYPESLSAHAEEALRARGVEVRTRTPVRRIEPGVVYFGEERVETCNVIWAAGVAASPLGSKLGAPTDRMGRVRVEPDLSVPGHPELFVIGDLAAVTLPDGSTLPGLAPVAIQQGRSTGENIIRRLNGEPTRPFEYRDRGTMSTIGRGAAVAEIKHLRLHGLPAWFAWIFIHIYFLIGFRNRVLVLFEWAWSYFSWQRGARLITGDVERQLVPVETSLE